MGEVTQLLHWVRQGENEALAELFRLAYPDLRRVAHARLKPITLQASDTLPSVCASFSNPTLFRIIFCSLVI
jgi:hypothetical protein